MIEAVLQVRESIDLFILETSGDGWVPHELVELPPNVFDGVVTNEPWGVPLDHDWAVFLLKTEDDSIIKAGRPVYFLESMNHKTKSGKVRIHAKIYMMMFDLERDLQPPLDLRVPTLVKQLVFKEYGTTHTSSPWFESESDSLACPASQLELSLA